MAAVLLAVGGGVEGLDLIHGPLGRDAPAPRRPPAASPRPLQTVSAAARRRDAVGTLLAARAQAVLAHDKPAFLAQLDPDSSAFRTAQDRMFDQVVKVPLASWAYAVTGDGPALGEQRALELPSGSTVVRVVLSYALEGSTSAVDREQYLTVVPRAGGWLLADDRDGQSSGLATQRDIWDLGLVTVVRGDSSLVIGAFDESDLRPYGEDADRSVRDVDRVWKRDWSRRPVVIVPRTQDDMAAIIDSDGKGLEQIAAVTAGTSESGLTRGDRVVINPAAWKTLGDVGRRVVIAHEVTHLATRASTYRAVPIWLSEGFADYVAYRSVDVPARVVAEDLRRLVRRGKAPRSLPVNADFDATKGDLAPAYEGAWLACRMVAGTYGQDKLIALYVALADAIPVSPDAAIRAILGIGEAKLVKDWRAYVADLA